jgi:site-specific recombinase XerC
MINRDNWKLVNKYLAYRERIDQVSENTIRLEKTWLNHLLEWADDIPFEKAHKIDPIFPQYVLTARKDGKEKPLSREYVRKLIGTAKRFLEWLRIHQAGYRAAISQSWLASFQIPRMTPQPKEHEAVTLEEIIQIAEAPTTTLREERIQAAAVFWYLSGIRISAFVTLPLKAVDIPNLTVKLFTVSRMLIIWLS